MQAEICNFLPSSVTHVIFMFQARTADPQAMTRELDNLHKSILERFKDSNGNTKQTSLVDFGSAFQNRALQLTMQNQLPPPESRHSDARELTADEQREIHRRQGVLNMLEDIKSRCVAFLAALEEEIAQRLPSQAEQFRKIATLHPSVVLANNRPNFEGLPLHHLMTPDFKVMERQYRRMRITEEWKHEAFPLGIPRDARTFWIKLFCFQREEFTGEAQEEELQFPFRKLAEYALSAMSVPASNAEVERIFSQVTVVKSKYRNKLTTKMLDGLIRVRMHLLDHGCCHKLQVTERMLKLFSGRMYKDLVVDDVGEVNPLQALDHPEAAPDVEEQDPLGATQAEVQPQQVLELEQAQAAQQEVQVLDEPGDDSSEDENEEAVDDVAAVVAAEVQRDFGLPDFASSDDSTGGDSHE